MDIIAIWYIIPEMASLETSVKMFQLKRLIEADLEKGSHRTYEFFTREIMERSKLGERGLDLEKSGHTQIDVGKGKRTTQRLSLHEFETTSGTHISISVWNVDRQGSPVGDMHTFMNFPGSSGQKTHIDGSSWGSMDGGDLEITPLELAATLAIALTNLNEKNWEVVVGDKSVNRPPGSRRLLDRIKAKFH